ncbi:MAG: hypothetical protein K2G76_00970, partial [Prevotella sp.]|nr:hypothetical protein [Prevotella sp.]
IRTMKQQLLKVLFVCMAVAFLPQVAHAAGDVEINATNFPDENFRNYLLEQDYGKDGILTRVERKRVTELDVSGKGIRSLQGIEFFPKLADLKCNNNLLASLDVSECTALTNLNCSGNPLTSLQRNNSLTSLDISKCTALTKLECWYTQLTSLDVSGCSALEYLECQHGQQLTSLNIIASGCTALKTLICTKSKLTSLNVSGCTALTYLECSRNRLAFLDVSSCTALISLHCDNNQLTALDVSKNTELTYLECYCNQIKGASMDNLINSLPINDNIEEPYTFYVYSPLASDERNEGNICTKKQVKAAKEKGWVACYMVSSNYWLDYAGSDDTPSSIDDIRTEDDKDAPVYNLRGERLTAPQKGVNIIGGRKVVVK